MPIASTRALTFDILLLVESGGYASDLLHARSGGLEPRDAALAHEIVFGVLRYRAQLDYLIAYYSGRGGRLDAGGARRAADGHLPTALPGANPGARGGWDTVQLVKRARKASAAGFVNAVLRKVNRDPVVWPDRATELSMPEWLLERWERRYGRAAAEGIARAALLEPEKYVRVTAAGERRQDIGAQSIVPLLELRAGQRFLDVCAAPGNKTAQALEAGVDAVACDVHFHRLAHAAGTDAETGAAGRDPAASFFPAVRSDPGGRALFRHRDAGPQSGDQVAAKRGRPCGPPPTAGDAAGTVAETAGAERNPCVFDVFAGARRE